MQSDKQKRQRRKSEISSWLGLQGKSKVNSSEFFSKPLLIKIRVTRVRKCLVKKGKVCIRPKWPIRPELIPVSVARSDYEYFYSPLDGMLVHRRVTPSVKCVRTHLYDWMERGTVGVQYLAQEHNAMSLARARTQTARSGDERNNHKDTAPPSSHMYTVDIFLFAFSFFSLRS